MADQQPGRSRAAGNRNREQRVARSQQAERDFGRYDMPDDDECDGGRSTHRASRTRQARVQVRRRS